MKTWDMTTISLGHYSIETDLPAKGYDGNHDIKELKVTSLPEKRRANIVFELSRPGTGCLYATDPGRVFQLLKSALGNHREISTGVRGNEFKSEFEITSNEQFCDAAISILKRLFDKFGMQEEELGNIEVSRETLVWRAGDNDWISFANHLVAKHSL